MRTRGFSPRRREVSASRVAASERLAQESLLAATEQLGGARPADAQGGSEAPQVGPTRDLEVAETDRELERARLTFGHTTSRDPSPHGRDGADPVPVRREPSDRAAVPSRRRPHETPGGLLAVGTPLGQESAVPAHDAVVEHPVADRRTGRHGPEAEPSVARRRRRPPNATKPAQGRARLLEPRARAPGLQELQHRAASIRPAGEQADGQPRAGAQLREPVLRPRHPDRDLREGRGRGISQPRGTAARGSAARTSPRHAVEGGFRSDNRYVKSGGPLRASALR